MKRRRLCALVACILVVVGCASDDNIYKAAAEGDLNRVKQLVELTPALALKSDRDGTTALMWAAGKGQLSVAEYLISKGADVNAKNISGRTPLHHAAYYGNIDIVKLLLSKGADPTIKNAEEKTPLDSAIKGKHDDIAELLRAKMSTTDHR